MSNELVVVKEPEPSYQGGAALSDLRAAAMSVSSETMRVGLYEYTDRRDTFRKWLLSQLIPGVHYGIPPGCEPKFDDSGNLLIWMKGGSRAVGKDQWQHKPSLYQAGADFVIDLMNLRSEFNADLGAWEMLGKPQGKMVYKCQLFSRATGELIGEGIGARTIGDKGGDLNNGVKMACKCAKVAAVINSYGLSDLFTQDIEDRQPEKHENPAVNPESPKAASRNERITDAELRSLTEDYKKHMSHLAPAAMFERWKTFCLEATGHQFQNIKSVSEWTRARLEKARQKMEMEWNDGQ
ncbi:MAG: hypothetical protein E6R04_07025 [Spirochaetes bacterium]|nr:MAG: hypothetical protein E6R04_07025 [Spirochaetota bacterium]